jgi:cobyrinic acid a,c-diamide synthase
MMYLCNSIVNTAGELGKACGILNANCEMKARFQSVGLQQVDYGQGEIRGHSFHHSTIVLDGSDVDDNASIASELSATKQNGDVGESIYRVGNATLSYMHHYFASNILASAALFRSEA